MPTEPSVALVTLGCTRNEVDSEELAGRLQQQGWRLVADAADADVAVVNTCGFVEQAKKDSIDTLLEAGELKETGRTQAVVAVGCLAERYGADLAAELPEADAVLGFDSYADMSEHLRTILDGGSVTPHVPRDRRTLLPLAPAARPGAGAVSLPGHGQAPLSQVAPASGPPVLRARLGEAPWAPLKIASGCDRRCAFCAIPTFRGAFVSRQPDEILTEARWLAERGVRELFLVSENTTSYGKDLGDLTLLERLLPELAAVSGIERVRVSYLQPAEIRPSLLEVMAHTPGVVPYFDISFQHASGPLLRRMRRFGDRESFLGLLGQVRERLPEAGVRTNVIVGFPGETEEDVTELMSFLEQARLDVVGVFGYSDEDGTEAQQHAGKHPEHVIAERVNRVSAWVEELSAQRAADRIGQCVSVLVEEWDPETGEVSGRAEQQGPDVDGTTTLLAGGHLEVGDLVRAEVCDSAGVDLIARVLEGRQNGEDRTKAVTGAR
ncbi:MAG TPA: 30S ribosomal protein S12 methylthiotransferase RimO [Ornithinimicrobium sp.]|uniref:30S ribosomal protein S12 methylthiotransferase RimO n=1 Tax=Ornithinimicrobium sp. TaxID=1977084 RepID=UPI002B47CACC|nr:30S ribosomal protein S12 methylthiotransferase RimO [Ornithinimicrobium sp.]HKJ10967.1 30S ribosomal protein S12 methylthiotransferase RimO [Ornithinimicrobium sp.]